jgi:SAM-dependent methyltransferase
MEYIHEPTILAERQLCAICNTTDFEIAIELPDLPLTGLYCQEAMEKVVGGLDQRLLVCTKCGHAQLAGKVAPGVLYDGSYSFRSSDSAIGRQGTEFFVAALDEIAGKKKFNCILDIGCNDLYLLKQLKGRSNLRVGIDPIWASIEDQRDDKSIIVSGTTIEDTKFDLVLAVPPDLIVCRHVLEHIYEPRAVLRKLLDIAADDALFLFEVPSFEELVQRLRFDQVFHQHLNYFTLASFQRLLGEEGAVSIGHRVNYQNWPALIVPFVKRSSGQKQLAGKDLPVFNIPAIRERYAIFQRQTAVANEVLKSLEGIKVYGYGAAAMLPILAYHLKNDLGMLASILDDDPSKDGLHFCNLPPIIRHTSSIMDIDDASVFITAVDNVKPILSKLLAHSPRHIIYPFHLI